MRRTFLGVAALVCAGMVATSCSSGTPETDSTVRQPYPKFLSQQDQDAIAYRATMRPVDPCGYLDESAVNQVATPDYFGADGALDTCSAKFRKPVGAKEIVSIEVSMDSASSGGYGRPATVGGTTVHVSETPDFCTAVLPFDDKQSLRFVVTTKGDLMGSGPRKDLCPEAASIAAAAAPHLSERPLRVNSPRAHMNTKLAKLDPCAVLGVVADGHPNPYVNPSPNPWKCQYNLDWADRSTSQHIDLSFDEDAELTRDPYSHETMSHIEGFPSLERPGDVYTPWADSCQIYLGTDPQWAPATPEPYTPRSHKVDMISVGVDGGGCETARATATELARLYKQLPN